MNWGTKLILGMATFMTFIIVLASLMMTSKNDDLVESDYYEKGINYDQEYQKKDNVKQHRAVPEILIEKDSVTITFRQPAKGKAKLIRTADKELDQEMEIKTDDLYQFRFPVKGMHSGLWKLQLDWISGETAYLFEKEITL